MHDGDVETFSASSGRELSCMSAVLHPSKEVAEGPVSHGDTDTEDDDEISDDASEENEVENPEAGGRDKAPFLRGVKRGFDIDDKQNTSNSSMP
jgi:hypothetical protein